MSAEINQDFVTYQGDDVSPIFTVRDSSGNPIDISTVQNIIWSARRNLDTTVALSKSKTGGSISFVTDGTDGQFEVDIATADTALLDGYYLHTATIVDSASNTTTVAVGRMQVGQAPAWTYDATLLASSTLYQVRRLVGDVLIGDQQLSDAEVNFAISLYSNSPYRAAAECCRQIAAQYSRLVDIVEGELKTNHSNKAKAYSALGIQLDARGLSKIGVMPYAGGISVSDKNAVAADPDRVAPAFNVGMDDNLQYPGPFPNQTPIATPSGGEGS